MSKKRHASEKRGKSKKEPRGSISTLRSRTLGQPRQNRASPNPVPRLAGGNTDFRLYIKELTIECPSQHAQQAIEKLNDLLQIQNQPKHKGRLVSEESRHVAPSRRRLTSVPAALVVFALTCIVLAYTLCGNYIVGSAEIAEFLVFVAIIGESGTPWVQVLMDCTIVIAMCTWGILATKASSV